MSSRIVSDPFVLGPLELTCAFAGCMGGALIVDYLGPKKQIILFLCLQGVVGFFMS